MILLYSGCGTRRLTSTTMVLVILVETTWPTFSLLIALVSAMLFLLHGGELPLAQDGQHTRAVLAHGPQFLQPFHLAHRHLKSETEELLIHCTQLILQFGIVLIANFLRLHNYSAISWRPMNLVRMASLWAARRI